MDLTTKPVYFVLEVESDLETVVSWITFQAFVRLDFAYLFGQVRTLSCGLSICIRHVYREANSATDFMANWICSHQTHKQPLSYWDLSTGLTTILHLDAHMTPHVRR